MSGKDYIDKIAANIGVEVSEENKDKIYKLHQSRKSLFKTANNVVKYTQNYNVLHLLYKNWIAIEHSLQRLWGFDKDINYVKVWLFPGCTCPKMDNEDCYPTGHISIKTCPYHGWR